MSMERRQPGNYLPLRDAIDRLFAGSVISPQTLGEYEGGFPPTDMHVDDDNVIIHMAIPGADPHDIDVSVTGETVTITGEVRHTDQSGAGDAARSRSQTYFQEIWHGRFQRSFTLPIQVDANQAGADFEHGLLTLTLPKAESTRPRKIQIGNSRTIDADTSSSQSSEKPETVQVEAAE